MNPVGGFSLQDTFANTDTRSTHDAVSTMDAEGDSLSEVFNTLNTGGIATNAVSAAFEVTPATL